MVLTGPAYASHPEDAHGGPTDLRDRSGCPGPWAPERSRRCSWRLARGARQMTMLAGNSHSARGRRPLRAILVERVRACRPLGDEQPGPLVILEEGEPLALDPQAERDLRLVVDHTEYLLVDRGGVERQQRIATVSVLHARAKTPAEVVQGRREPDHRRREVSVASRSRKVDRMNRLSRQGYRRTPRGTDVVAAASRAARRS